MLALDGDGMRALRSMQGRREGAGLVHFGRKRGVYGCLAGWAEGLRVMTRSVFVCAAWLVSMVQDTSRWVERVGVYDFVFDRDLNFHVDEIGCCLLGVYIRGTLHVEWEGYRSSRRNDSRLPSSRSVAVNPPKDGFGNIRFVRIHLSPSRTALITLGRPPWIIILILIIRVTLLRLRHLL